MKISVVIPVYRGKRFIRDTLESVQGQTFDGQIETLVIEDGSPAEETVQSLCEEFHVPYIYLSENRGVMAARIFGVAQLSSETRYVALLDQDDRWAPDFVRRTVDVMEQQPAVGFVATNARLIDDGEGKPLWSARRPSLLLEDLKVANQIISPSQVMIRYAAWMDAIPKLSGDLHGGADDWLFWLAILSQGYCAHYVQELLMDYRIHDGGAHHQKDKMLQSSLSVVNEWFPKLGFTDDDRRRFYGRRAFDGLVEGIRERDWERFGQSVFQGVRDPWAIWEGFRFRQRHKREGIV